MPPPPNPSLAELAATLGEENVRTLVRTFLRDFPISFQELSNGNRHNRHRVAHSMKGNCRLMGGHELYRRLAEIEERLSEPDGGDVTPQDLEAISSGFAALAVPLRHFVGS
jgi:HPt (histidine-containing phosphotransfer) domain-containing protein